MIDNIKENNILTANLGNLTALWKQVGVSLNSYFKNDQFEYCDVQNSSWPNKIWFKKDLQEAAVDLVIGKMQSSSNALTLPYWDIYESRSYELLESKGFTEKSRQVGMSLALDKPYPEQGRLTIRQVSNEEEIKLWSGIYPRAFGYKISEEILQHTHKDIPFYLVYAHNQPVGTAILFQTGKIAGVHGVGIIPEVRRNGYAEEIMKFVINRAIDQQATHVTLQASALGKGIYEKLGFKEQFIIRNYVRLHHLHPGRD